MNDYNIDMELTATELELLRAIELWEKLRKQYNSMESKTSKIFKAYVEKGRQINTIMKDNFVDKKELENAWKEREKLYQEYKESLQKDRMDAKNLPIIEERLKRVNEMVVKLDALVDEEKKKSRKAA